MSRTDHPAVPTMLRYAPLAYLVLFLVVAFAWPTLRVWRRTGINPVTLGASDSAHDFLGRTFKLILAALVAVLLVQAAWPAGMAWLVPIRWLEHPPLAWLGAALMVAAMVWIVTAQVQMGASWRVGIDQAHATALVTRGLFARSRNPIFLGLAVALGGLVLVSPNAATLLIAALGLFSMQVQVRMEEAHLDGLHGAAYADYRRRVRRWL